MRKTLWFVFPPLIAVVGSARAGVTLTASVSGVQKGNTITFTATTDESDPVVKVTFSYEGTGSTDEDTSSPYQVVKTMDWTAMEDLTVTATFDFESISDQQDTVDVDVVDILLIGAPQPLRGATATYIAVTQPRGISVSSWAWSCDNAVLDANWTDTANSDDVSVWMGIMAVSGTIEVSATLLGVACESDKSVSIRPRTGGVWVTPVDCAEDNEPNWGSPLLGLGEALGQLRDKDSNLNRIIVPQTSEDDWSDAVTLSQISSGPNTGIWYVRTNTLEIDMETVINQFAKSGGPSPEGGATNFYDYNNGTGGCLEGEMDDFIQALENHEYRGTPPAEESLEGHFGRIEYELNVVGDPSAEIEDHIDTTESGLMDSVNVSIGLIEGSLGSFSADGAWSDAGPNWGGTGSLGSGKHTRYDIDSSQYYSGCTFGPDMF